MNKSSRVDIVDFLRVIPDFPKPGILFRDISPLLSSPEAYRYVVQEMARRISALKVDALVGIESRGFLFAAPLAVELGVPLVMVRKPGKLPGTTESIQYGLEYGSDALHLQSDALRPDSAVVIVDDVLATGGTAQAVGSLIQQVGARVVSYLFLAELHELKGREKLGAGVTIEALVKLG